ncbi:MAG: gamma-glutamylcyclotransferase [Hyphomicrobiales bacterium]|nr:MAG: gamma-glutamylcyclotransferase [Hyphomicrobiales bacterium]
MPEEPPEVAVPLSQSPPRYVFVYGTLRRGGSNDITRLEPAPQWVGRATLPGALYTLGPYPGMRLAGHTETNALVHGEVYAISQILEDQLDRIEGLVPGAEPSDGDEYVRREVWVTVEGMRLRCLMYEVHARYAIGHARMLTGDWMQG